MRVLFVLSSLVLSLNLYANVYPAKFECVSQGHTVFSIGKSAQLGDSVTVFWMNQNLNSLFPSEVSYGPVVEMRSSRVPSGNDRLEGYQVPLLIKGVVQNYGFNNTSEIFIKAEIDFNNQFLTLTYNPVYNDNPKHQGYRFMTKCDQFSFKYL